MREKVFTKFHYFSVNFIVLHIVRVILLRCRYRI
nr:MAG TPA: hypothetical protein [Caudoviricetes sp.]DAN54801.1 MAG TPA: hypothetical protein [Caudoviricetes sp.]